MNLETVVAALALLAITANSGAQSATNGNFGAARKVEEAKPRPPPAPAQRVKSYPFRGELDSVAADGLSLKMRGKTKPRIILVSSETRTWRGEATATLQDAQPGERVTGSVFRNEQGKEQALTVRLGGKPKSPE